MDRETNEVIILKCKIVSVILAILLSFGVYLGVVARAAAARQLRWNLSARDRHKKAPGNPGAFAYGYKDYSLM